MKEIKKMTNFKSVSRDELTKRAVIITSGYMDKNSYFDFIVHHYF